MHIFILILNIIFNLFLVGVMIKCLFITKEKNVEKTYKTIICLLFGLGGLLTISVIARFINDAIHDSDVILLATNLIYVLAIVTLIIVFIKSSYIIAKNIKNNQLFVEENVIQLDNISHFFIYYSLFTSVSGIFINIIKMIVNKSIIATFSMSSSFFIYLILGIVFHVVSILLSKSIEAYEENKLTI